MEILMAGFTKLPPLVAKTEIKWVQLVSYYFKK
jgi:hypothetical protein